MHKFKEAGGCEAEMMFVRPGDFDERLVRNMCMREKPHSCGPGAWSLERDRGGWDAQTRAWAAERARSWPSASQGAARGGGGRAAGREGGGGRHRGGGGVAAARRVTG